VPSPCPVKTVRASGEKLADRISLRFAPGSFRTIRPLATSQTIAVLSQLAVNARVPSAEKLTEKTSFLAPVNRCTILPLARSQRIAERSAPPVSARRPSGEILAERIPSECPFNVRTIRPLGTSHRMAVLSQLPVSMKRPSGENATDRTALVWPPKQWASIRILGVMPRLPSVVARRCAWSRGVRKVSSRPMWRSTVVSIGTPSPIFSRPRGAVAPPRGRRSSPRARASAAPARAA